MYEFNVMKQYKSDFLDKTGVNIIINCLVKMKHFLNITALSLRLINHRTS